VTPKEAAEVWKRVKRQLDKLSPQLETAADVLKGHFRKTNYREFQGVGYAKSTYSSLDTKAVKAHLGKDLDKFLVSRSRETLSLVDR
jgi:hypothetical protein